MDESVKRFSKADFNTEEPYKQLFALRNNRFKYNQMFTSLTENAEAVNFKGFGRMFKAFAEEQAGKGVIIDNVTQFEGQTLELKTGEWLCDDFGVTRRNERNGEDIACVHPIMPVERLTNIDTGIEKVRVAFNRGEGWKNEIYERRMLADSRSILDLSINGVAVTSESSRSLVRYLHDIENLNYGTLPHHNSVGRLGWTNRGEFSPYVEDLVFDGNNDFEKIYGSIKSRGSFDVWLNEARTVRKTDSPARIMLAAGFASVLIKPLGRLNFMVHFWGGSESGKSVSQMFATSIWADPGEDAYIQTFNGTQVGTELLAGFVNSMPLVLDEFQLSKDKKAFEIIVYMLCEGIGRIRGKKTGGIQKTPTWKNCTLTSGEDPVTSNSSGGGAVNRIIEIECKNALFKDAPATADIIRKNYGHAGKAFITLLRADGALEEAERLYKEFYRTLSPNATEKQSMAAAMILTADALATKWIFCDGRALRPDEISKYLSTKESIDTNLRAYEYLRDNIMANYYKFAQGSIMPSGECWGSISGGKINIFKSMFEKVCTEGGFDSKALASWMKQKGYSECASDRPYKKVSVNNMKNWCVSLKADDTDESEFVHVDNQEDLPFR